MRRVRKFAILATYYSTNRRTFSLGSNASFRIQLGVVAGRADSSQFEFLERRERRESVGFARSWATCYGRYQWGHSRRIYLEKPVDVSNAKPVVLVRYPMILDHVTRLFCDTPWYLVFRSAIDFAARTRSSSFSKELSSPSSAGIAITSCYGGTKKKARLLASTGGQERLSATRRNGRSFNCILSSKRQEAYAQRSCISKVPGPGLSMLVSSVLLRT